MKREIIINGLVFFMTCFGISLMAHAENNVRTSISMSGLLVDNDGNPIQGHSDKQPVRCTFDFKSSPVGNFEDPDGLTNIKLIADGEELPIVVPGRSSTYNYKIDPNKSEVSFVVGRAWGPAAASNQYIINLSFAAGDLQKLKRIKITAIRDGILNQICYNLGLLRFCTDEPVMCVPSNEVDPS